MQIFVDTLKTPSLYCAEQVLGSSVPKERVCNHDLITRVSTYALALIFGICLIASLPLWFVGDLLDNQSFEERTIEVIQTPLEELSLDPQKTTFMGFPISTYQYTSDPDFCKDSDWHTYSQTHFTGPTAHLAPGGGVDILTEDGMKLICDVTCNIGGNTVRFSIDWANDVPLDRYVQVAEYIHERGLTPIAVFHHFVTPLNRNGKNLFESEEGINLFVTHSLRAHERLKHVVRHFCTFNEPKICAVENYVLGDFPAKGIAQFYQCERVTRNMLEAHTRIYAALHTTDPTVNVGMTHQALRMIPSSKWNYLARITAFVFTHLFHESFLQWAENNQNKLDFLGVQYYTRPYIAGFPPDSTCREGEQMVDSMHFRFDPLGLLPILREMGKKLPNVPLFVSETGTAGTNSATSPNEMDERRATYMELSLRATRTAQNEGINVRGYMPWGPFDNFEWAHGNSPAHGFGLIARDRITHTLRPTQGFHVVTTVFKNTLLAAA